MCPSSRVLTMEAEPRPQRGEHPGASELRQWPLQLHLIPPDAPFLKNANIVLVADCVPFAYADFHREFMRGNAIAIGCPKLDDGRAYVDKVSQIFARAKPKSITVVVMEVPCCSGLMHIAREAAVNGGVGIPIGVAVIGIRGSIVSRNLLPFQG